MKRIIRINRLQLSVPGTRSAADGRTLAKQVTDKLANSFREFDTKGLPDVPGTIKVRVPPRSRPGHIANAVRSAIGRKSSGPNPQERGK